MATKKSASKKAVVTPREAAAETAAAKKAPAKKTAAKKTAETSGPEHTAAAARTAPEPAATTAAKPAAQTAVKTHPSHHDIAVHAYLLWERDGKKHGHHDGYWQQAEKELMGR